MSDKMVNKCKNSYVPFPDGRVFCGEERGGFECQHRKCENERIFATGEHFVNIYEEYFKDVVEGSKSFELRRNDRSYKVGDFVCMREVVRNSCRKSFTGRYVVVEITRLWSLADLSEDLADYVMFTFDIINIGLRRREDDV